MTVAYETYRGWPAGSHSGLSLEDKFEILKDIGDGSFGSVALGRTRTAGAHVVRRGTLVAIKTMKKTYENFAQCLELREVVFLKTLPNHPHLVPAYDIFLDPLSKKLHIAMEYMDGNLYQLMKARDHKPMDCSSVKSILYQILSGLEHVHAHNFFHRDIKPENILVSTSAPDIGNNFKRYSALVTPPATPPTYSIKIADFGLAREQHSRLPYTTYVSTRWYRAPEVLLRAGEYSAPVDIWAVGAMAVEVATLKPLFPGGNEVDQVWRVCEIMGSPGGWINKQGHKVGGGEWKDGIKLAQKLGFSFPKMAPHSLETVLPPPTWPTSLADLVTWCLMWDPKTRPTSRQALEHEYFEDAVDPLRPKSSGATRILGRKASNLGTIGDYSDGSHVLTTKTSSWFRKSLGAKEPVLPSVPALPPQAQIETHRPLPVHANTTTDATAIKARPVAAKRATWANSAIANSAPIPILPSIRPVSPVPDTVTAQAKTMRTQQPEERAGQKIGRQLSVNSQGNHYAEIHRQEAERALTGANSLKSPTGSQKESFFSHLRKRARRFSGRPQGPMSPNMEDQEANAGCAPWPANASNRQSVQDYQAAAPSQSGPPVDSHFADLDRALQNVRYSLDATLNTANNTTKAPVRHPPRVSSNPALKRHYPLPSTNNDGRDLPVSAASSLTPNRARRSVKHTHPAHRYETPDEQDELLDEALACAHKAAKHLDGNVVSYRPSRPTVPHVISDPSCSSIPYLTPSPSKDHDGVSFGSHDYTPSKPMDIPQLRTQKNAMSPQWPTPPYEENDWATAAAASIYATQAAFH